MNETNYTPDKIGGDGYPLEFCAWAKTQFPPIPYKAKLFQHPQTFGYKKPKEVLFWSWSTTFNRWSAYVRFSDNIQTYTYPKL